MPEGPIESKFSAAQPTGSAPAPIAAKVHDSRSQETPKETIISIIIAFALAFVFRGFVIEAFVIPTGSMAPTLLGQHMRFRDGLSGFGWTVSPWHGRSPSEPTPIQENISVLDPMSGSITERATVSVRSGDRILVLKYLYALFEPERYDVIVFKNPAKMDDAAPPRPVDNYIKRLVGLPGEQIALVDGDVFVRKPVPGESPAGPMDVWNLADWKIARKPLLAQRAVWQPVFDSSYSPWPMPPWFQSPWRGSGDGWSTDARVYHYRGDATTTLAFDQGRVRFNDPGIRDMNRRAKWLISDRYAYNEGVGNSDRWQDRTFPVSDVRLRAGIKPESPDLRVTARIVARSHEFEARLIGDQLILWARMPFGPQGVMMEKTLGSATVKRLDAGRITNFEFWHVDQALSVFLDGDRVLGPVNLDWTPADRIRYSTGRPLSDLVANQPNTSENLLQRVELYKAPEVSWSFSGPVALHRVALDRDLYYRPDTDYHHLKAPALATSPFSPLVLKEDQFFCCGDNSPQSLDGRLWGYPEPWIAAEFGNDPGVVHRDLILGRAFFVYWPSLVKGEGPLAVPDFGRMRFIW